LKQIMVYDDDTGVADKYVEKLRNATKKFKTDPMSQEAFLNQLDFLKERREATREARKWTNDAIDMDKISIFIIDFDLMKTHPFLTGEEAAYLLRCYSRCGLIIGLNLESGRRVLPSYFDLTLRGHPDSFCDLNIDAAQLDNPGLWTNIRNGFRPWHWPQIPDYLDLLEKKISCVLDNPAKPIVQLLQFDGILQLFPSSALQFLGGKPAEVTFKQFVVNSGNGLRGKDKTTDEMIARIAAARVSKWLERLILPGQDILVDAPHLVSRFPSLLKGDQRDLAIWNKITELSSNVGSLPLMLEKIESFTFKENYWLSRPAWFWNNLYTNDRILEVANPFKKIETEFVFCEDSSTFERKENCREFYATIDSPYNQRYIHARPFQDVDYAPAMALI